MNRYKQVLSTLIITPVKQAANTTAAPLIINYLEIYKNDNKTKFRIALKDKLLTERESQDCYCEKEIRLFHKRNVRFQLSNTSKEHRNKLQKRFRMKIKASNKEFSLLLRNCRLDHSRGNCLNLAISENVYVSVKKQQQVE